MAVADESDASLPMKWRIFSTFVKFLSAEISPASVSGALIWSFSLFLVEDEKNSVKWAIFTKYNYPERQKSSTFAASLKRGMFLFDL